MLEIAKAHGVDAAQVLIGWLTAKEIVALPKSTTPERISSNAKPASLSAEDVKKLDDLAGPGGKQNRLIRPPWGVVLGFEDWHEAAKQLPA